MAWAEKQRSGRWAGKYRDAAGRTRSVGTYTRRAEAQRKAAAKEEDTRRRPGQADPKSGRLTWAGWLPHWLALRTVEPGTAIEDEKRITKHLLPRWGDVRLDAIRPQDVQEWVEQLAEPKSRGGAGLGPQTVHHCYHNLSASLRAAVMRQNPMLDVSPCRGITLPPLPDPDERYLTHHEVDAIAEVLSGKYRTMLLLLVGTGMRWGEAAGLHWHRVDLDDGYIDVREVLDAKTGEIKPYDKAGSTAHQRLRRRVWLADWLVDELRAHRAQFPRGPECAVRHRGGARCRSSLVVPGRGGVAIDYSSYRTMHWGRAVGQYVWVIPGDAKDRTFRHPSAADKALRGYPGRAVRREWRDGLANVGPATLHDLRHTYASWALQADPPMATYDLAVSMGHTETEMTRRYGHLGRSSRDRARAALAWPSRESATQVPRSASAEEAS